MTIYCESAHMAKKPEFVRPSPDDDDGFDVRCSLAPDEILFLRVSRTLTPATTHTHPATYPF